MKKVEALICYSWGTNKYEQTAQPISETTVFSKIFSDESEEEKLSFCEIFVGVNHSVGLTTDGKIYSWGKVIEEVTYELEVMQTYIPVLVTSLVNVKVMAVCCGKDYTLALSHDSSVSSWGSNSHGQLGHGNKSFLASPKEIETFQKEQVESLVCGDQHSICLTKDGYYYVFGDNTKGALFAITKKNFYFLQH